MLALRNYHPQDFGRLLEIDEACFIEGIAYTADELRSFIALPTALTLIGQDGRNIQGFIIADRFRQRRTSRYMGRIITIDVAPEHQSTGVGALLLCGAEQELKRSGCDYIVLEVAVDNEKALRFYKKHAYSVLKVLPKYYLDSIDGFMMGKKV